jgi:hypothetical protein
MCDDARKQVGKTVGLQKRYMPVVVLVKAGKQIVNCEGHLYKSRKTRFEPGAIIAADRVFLR